MAIQLRDRPHDVVVLINQGHHVLHLGDLGGVIVALGP
jgi:hypothetical protein